jgi:beta-1,4-N-acetylglucosaminyltransferase
MTSRRRRPTRKRPIALVGSNGGHLAHLLALKPWWEKHDRFWVTFKKIDALTALEGERSYWAYGPTNRNAWNLVRNSLVAVRVLLRERPSMIVSSGAAVAVPFFYLARLFGAQTIFIEVVDRIDQPTLTGRLIRPVATRVMTQWPGLLQHYPAATLIGRLL